MSPKHGHTVEGIGAMEDGLIKGAPALGGRTSDWLSNKVAEEVIIPVSFPFTLWFAASVYYRNNPQWIQGMK